MKTNIAQSTKNIAYIAIIALAAFLSDTSTAQAAWSYGIGTGLTATQIDGQQGFNSLVGPIKYDVNLTPSDLNEMTKTAFGFGGYASDGTWLIQYSLSNIELEDTSTTVMSGTKIATKINFTTRGFETTAAYPFYKSTSVVALFDFGLRYTDHEFDNTTKFTGGINTRASNNFSNSWTDALVGVIFNVPFGSRKWTWTTRLNAGYGGSEGTYLASTGVFWKFHKNWTVSLTGKYLHVKYENGSQGDNDWYYYDAEEKSLGLTILYTW